MSKIAVRGYTQKGKGTSVNTPFKPLQHPLGNAYSFKFTTTKENKGEEYFPGHFRDAQTLAEVLLQSNHISLAKAGEKLNTKIRKMKDIEHGKVTERYIDYLIQDVDTTYEVYQKLIEELDLYPIDISPTQIYSATSLGKHTLKQIVSSHSKSKYPSFLIS
jgi:hypothetical protein